MVKGAKQNTHKLTQGEIKSHIEVIINSLREEAKRNPDWRHVELQHKSLKGKALTAEEVIQLIQRDREYGLIWVNRAIELSIQQMQNIYSPEEEQCA